MKKILIYPEKMLGESSLVFQNSEPASLHCVLWLVAALITSLLCFLCIGKMDDVVKSQGIVRPEINVSTINNITSGEIQSVLYKPGDFVSAGQELLLLKGDTLEAQKKVLSLQFSENKRNLSGVYEIILSYETGKNVFLGNDLTAKSRYEAFIAEKNLLEARVKRTCYLYDEERKLPESSTTRSQIECLKYDFEIAELELTEYCKNFISGARQEYDSLKIEQENLFQEIRQLEVSMKNLVLVSPIDGYVQEISSLNPGDYIFTDQPVLNIVPGTENACRIELRIPAEKMGKLEIGQKVKLRFPAFPYHEYRGINGTIQIIQPDSQISDSGELFFTAYADAESLVLHDKKGIAYPIKPGFEVNARIVLENQTLLYFLLKKLDFAV